MVYHVQVSQDYLDYGLDTSRPFPILFVRFLFAKSHFRLDISSAPPACDNDSPSLARCVGGGMPSVLAHFGLKVIV